MLLLPLCLEEEALEVVKAGRITVSVTMRLRGHCARLRPELKRLAQIGIVLDLAHERVRLDPLRRDRAAVHGAPVLPLRSFNRRGLALGEAKSAGGRSYHLLAALGGLVDLGARLPLRTLHLRGVSGEHAHFL